ncbi:hypothetical protein HUJ04_005000 [Dendroctonus ponderosae]|nr:hypothetical protein HUJ04_005000 [Dendroctonus ponderosae]
MVLTLERFIGKVAVVTGASAGIGAAIVEELVKNGLIVAGLARRINKIEKIAHKLSGQKGTLCAFKCDLTEESQIIATVEEVIGTLGPISILINNAGLSQHTSLLRGETKKWKTVLDTNILGLCIVTREVAQNIIANKTAGHIIHINSVLGHVVLDIPGLNMYGPTKYAVTSLAETLRLEINREKLHVKVTSISPGYVKTEFQDIAEFGELPMPALHPADVADAVIYALSTPPHVAGLARRTENVEKIAQKLTGQKGKLYAFKCDMTVEAEVIATIKQIIAKLGPISILINNAGLSLNTSLLGGDTKKWKTVLDTNILGLCIATREVAQNMIANKTAGHIIHINSVLGHQVIDFPGLNVYGPSKYAVTALAETLRLEINREKLQIKVTSISPGYVKTDIQSVSGLGDLPIPPLDPADIADAVIYALSTHPHVNVSELTVRAVGS